jgi:hypothetical protein
MDWKLPGYAKDMEQLIDVIHTTYCIYAKVEEGGRVRWFLYILLFALKELYFKGTRPARWIWPKVGSFDRSLLKEAL